MFFQPGYFLAVPGVVPGRFQEKGHFPEGRMVDDVDEGLFSQAPLADGFMAGLGGGGRRIVFPLFSIIRSYPVRA